MSPLCSARPGRSLRLAAALSAMGPLAFAWSAEAGPAIGQFEMKTLESAPGYLEFQSQNAWSFGQPRRESEGVDPETIYDDNAVVRQREALEMEMGFTSYLKMRLGIEFEQERIDDPPTPAEANDFGASHSSDEVRERRSRLMSRGAATTTGGAARAMRGWTRHMVQPGRSARM